MFANLWKYPVLLIRATCVAKLLNEEGLPIIDIVEPVTDEKTSSQPANVFDDPDLLPLWALSPAEKARRRAERERILDLLEAQESLEQEREEAAERERTRADLEKRKEAAKDELESLRKAKELQKKMGKALLRNVIEAKEREDQENARREEQENAEREERRKLKPKKSVTFAEPPSDDEKPKSKQEGGSGDVSLARLQLRGKNTLLTQAQIDKQPMKMHVVERNPGGLRSPPPPPSGQLEDHDSDDESDPGSPVPADSDEGDIIHSDHSDDDHLDQIRPPPSSESEDGGDERMSDDGEPVEWREDDFDFAQHQREIALAYYEKRATIGAEVASAMRAHSHEGEHEWDQPEVPLEATLASGPPKPSISRFKSESASSGMSSSTLASHSLGPSVLPASQSSTLKSAIRMGKLQNGQLFGDESDDDVEEEARKIVELLSQGEVTNIGPQPISISSPRSTVPQGNAPVAANSSSVPSPAAAQTVQRSPAA
ncbi:hypothetical protein WOLCODRAFT_22915 [Wolfiporia cocos MD-104 SS10]|uniref:DUF3835 domain-containing protein n=1 Tax=Wolfiporia cocos (strain MD-104) TaxID=742152 RepID=A0A2H3JPD2_WOLCO|nr:hypothetical protein WOLCODRAFT_22915 [Wolfiporia cocos MD-104 SS10]